MGQRDEHYLAKKHYKCVTFGRCCLEVNPSCNCKEFLFFILDGEMKRDRHNTDFLNGYNCNYKAVLKWF